jgi:hypothetical protein
VTISHGEFLTPLLFTVRNVGGVFFDLLMWKNENQLLEVFVPHRFKPDVLVLDEEGEEMIPETYVNTLRTSFLISDEV